MGSESVLVRSLYRESRVSTNRRYLTYRKIGPYLHQEWRKENPPSLALLLWWPLLRNILCKFFLNCWGSHLGIFLGHISSNASFTHSFISLYQSRNSRKFPLFKEARDYSSCSRIGMVHLAMWVNSQYQVKYLTEFHTWLVHLLYILALCFTLILWLLKSSYVVLHQLKGHICILPILKSQCCKNIISKFSIH
jgi:hypothetical protein